MKKVGSRKRGMSSTHAGLPLLAKKKAPKRQKKPSKLTVLIALMGVAALAFYVVSNRQNASNVVRGDIPFEFSRQASLKAGEATDSKSLEEGIAIIDAFLDKNKLKNNPNIAYLYATKGSLQAKKGELREALESTLKAIEANPKDPRYYAHAAEYYGYLGDTAKSEEYYRKALKVYDSGLPAGYKGHGRDFFANKVSGQQE